ncbi:MAG: acyltransferase family protein [Candidatus Gastranaerophilaceae bacterium]
MTGNIKREEKIDAIKGILIFLVVFGHSKTDFIHDIIFLFHMPLFFIVSGFLLNKSRLYEKGYIRKRVFKLILPYCSYLFIDFILLRRNYSLDNLMHMFYGGRAINGVYWYITCFLFALFLFSTMLKKLSEKMTKIIILLGGCVAILESYLVEHIYFLKSPGIPWNLDVSLMALVYIGIGFFYKKIINEIFENNSKRYDILAVIIFAIIVVFCCFYYKNSNRIYYFDMKVVYYKELISAIFILCAFGLIIVRIVHYVVKINCLKTIINFFCLCGRTTLPIMFMHIPLNYFKDTLGYGRLVYIIVGLGIPLLLTICCNKLKITGILFGFPYDINSKRINN